jgi:hypothetical protein
MSYRTQYTQFHLHPEDEGYKLLWDTEVSPRTTKKHSILPPKSKNFFPSLQCHTLQEVMIQSCKIKEEV